MAERPKLTARQVQDLRALAECSPISFTTWGGEALTRLPRGLTTTRLWRLADKGVAGVKRLNHLRERWAVTEAGRQYLASLENSDG
ncbi:hypothetical protein EV668_3199 [Enterovirga rhinocerotis]|uniref:Uncharacterized protein n=1 Tax=Enterovirga rhinocerotis TaxID=1339210 RepID=A0A4R7BWP9_9HYPH|nr:hypothetical protein EV668_3199 [Enterovirga rhinocerotis]